MSKGRSNYQTADAFASWNAIGAALEQPTETSIADIIPWSRAVTAGTIAAMEEVARLSPLAALTEDVDAIGPLVDAVGALSGTLYTPELG